MEAIGSCGFSCGSGSPIWGGVDAVTANEFLKMGVIGVLAGDADFLRLLKVGILGVIDGETEISTLAGLSQVVIIPLK